MKFNKLTYLHTESFEDEGVKEIKFAADFKNSEFENNTIEIWKGEDGTDVLMVCSETNYTSRLDSEEEFFVLNYATENNLL
ncbi:hypothetical protein M3649_03990 [Ureibacillus chungkukjangi]|uniref:hypothetical protein n=1 Tax=Ureibacillus chungkukjangi TaxID=1202712 RepID=UPI00203DB55D|nr:hypothetical protein [Ureibacillus chungkukjangi]MCM3387293.1 hypothetical protein [Ureibacillus chungkukjangi]